MLRPFSQRSALGRELETILPLPVKIAALGAAAVIPTDLDGGSKSCLERATETPLGIPGIGPDCAKGPRTSATLRGSLRELPQCPHHGSVLDTAGVTSRGIGAVVGTEDLTATSGLDRHPLAHPTAGSATTHDGMVQSLPTEVLPFTGQEQQASGEEVPPLIDDELGVGRGVFETVDATTTRAMKIEPHHGLGQERM